MKVYTVNNKSSIKIIGETIVDGIKLGIIMEKLKNKKINYITEIDDGNIQGVSIEQRDLIDLLC